MDYFNFQIEYDKLFDYTKEGINSLINFSNFLKTYIKYSEQLYSNTIKIVNNIISEMVNNNEENESTLSIHFFEFYNSFSEYLKSINIKNNKLEYDILNPLNEFISHIKTQNSLVFSEFNNLINETYNQKKKYEQCKNNYIESSKIVTENEKLIIKKVEEKEKNLSNEKDISIAEKEISDLTFNLLKLKENTLNDNEKYKIEFEKTNKLFEEKNKLYFPIFLKIKEIEESKETLIKFSFEKINHIFKSRLNSSQEFMASISTSMTEINIQNDMNLFYEKFNYKYRKNIRIPKEEIFNYDLYRRNIESMIQKNKMLLKKESKSLFSNPEIFMINNENQKSIFSSEENMIIEGLFFKTDVDNFKFENLCKKTLNKSEYAKEFIDKILERYVKVIGIQILNQNNFERLNTIFTCILNNKIIQSELFEINFAICFIAEKTFYQNEINPFSKIYLCQLLTLKNPKLKSKDFWHNLLILKINNAISQKAEKYVKKEMSEEEEKENNKINNNDSTFQSFFDVSKFFNPNEKNEKMKIYHEKFNKYIIENKKVIALNILKDFVPHFSCFNLDSSDIFDIINDTSIQYGFDDEKDKLKFFITVINSNLYSIKNIKFNFQKDNLNIIKKEDYHYHNFFNKNYLSRKNNYDKKILIILNTLKYLNSSDYINLMCLDKKSNKIIMKKIYKNLLLNLNESISKKIKIPNIQNYPEIRIKIWKKLLNYKTLNYKEIITQFEKEKLPSYNLINLDVNRMWFDEKLEETRKSILNILCTLSYYHKEIIYSQGMNYIAEFLFFFTKSEDESFYIFNSILESTDYIDLFANELKRLNKYFYVFDRLINIYLPEIYLHLKNKEVSVTFYISPWFITLFMSSFHHISDIKNPKVLIWIFDLFILYGWKGIIRIGLCLMKHFENKILSLNGEMLLSFLINDILKLDFFQTNNYEKLRKIYSVIKLENGLIENLENEYELKQKIQI